MTEQEPTPAPDHISADRVDPHPMSIARGRFIMILVLAVAIVVAVAGAGTGISLYIANKAGDKATHTANKVDDRSTFRDNQTRALVNRIDALARKVDANQKKTTNVLCSAIVSSVTQQEHGPTPPSAQQLMLTLKFLRDYGCKLPPKL